MIPELTEEELEAAVKAFNEAYCILPRPMDERDTAYWDRDLD